MTKWQFAVVVAVALVAGLVGGDISKCAYADEQEAVLIAEGFCRAGDFLEFSPAEKVAYAMGFINGIHLSPLFDTRTGGVLWLVDGMRDTNNVQIAAILTKYIENNPQTWHEFLNVVGYRALLKAFKKDLSPATK